MRRVAIFVSGALVFLTACSIGVPTPVPPTPTPADRRVQIAQLTQVAANLQATAESKAATATAAVVPTVAPTPTPTKVRPTPTATVPSPPTAVAQATATVGPNPNVADNLADFRMKTYQGEASMGGHETQLSNAFAYGLPVVLNFWAPLCPPCRAEMPAFQRVSDEFAGQVFFLGVDVSPYLAGFGGPEEAVALIRATGIHYPVAYAVDSPVKAYGLKSIPTTVFFTPDGKIAKTVVGDLTEAALRNNVTVLMASGATTPARGDGPPGGNVPFPVVPALSALPPRAEGRP